MAQIIGIGANVFDTLFRLEHYPHEDTKQKALSVTESGGGPCGTGLVAAAKLGASCAYIGNCSDDSAGTFLREDFRTYGVDTTLMTTIPNTSAFRSCIWLCDDTAARTCVFHRGTVPPTVIDAEKAAAIQAANLLMVDGNDLDAAVRAAEIARQSETAVLYDAGGLYEGVERLLALTDILIPSEEFALKHTGAPSIEEAARQLFSLYNPTVVVVTCGKQGGVLFDGTTLTHYPAFCVEAVDTNGAGDVFHGAFAYARTRCMGWEACCLFASAVSALKCTGVGARQSAPDRAQVEAFLTAHGVQL